MKRFAGCWLGALAFLLLAPDAAGQRAEKQASADGSAVIGDYDAAFGMVLQPWREEAVSDIDRPPRVRDLGADAEALRDARAHALQYEALHRFHRAQPKRR